MKNSCVIELSCVIKILIVNYPALPRSGLPGSRIFRTERPGSVSELAPEGTAVPDSAGDFPRGVVRSVPLFPNGHSTTTADACFLSRLNTGTSVVNILLQRLIAKVVQIWRTVEVTKDGRCIRTTHFLRSSGSEGALPAFQLKDGL